MSNDTIQERVARGAAWLDEVRPGWVDLVDIGDLVMWSGCDCVCGQVFSDADISNGYSVMERMVETALGIECTHDDAVWEWACLHGFHNPEESSDAGARMDEWMGIADEWRSVITKRRDDEIAGVLAAARVRRVAVEQREAVAHEC